MWSFFFSYNEYKNGKNKPPPAMIKVNEKKEKNIIILKGHDWELLYLARLITWMAY